MKENKEKTLSYINTSPRNPNQTGSGGGGSSRPVNVNVTAGAGGQGLTIDLEALKELLRRELADLFLSSQLDDIAEGRITFQKGIVIRSALVQYIITSFGMEEPDDQSVFTAARVLLELSKLDDRYLFKIKPDETPYHIGLLGGLTTTEVESTDYAEGTQKAGWAAKKNINDEWMVESDHLIARILASVYDLLVENHATFKNSLSSEEFISGFAGGKGWAIRTKEYVNAAGVTEKRSVAEFDDLVVRGTMRLYELIVSQLLGENDNRIFTAMMEVDHYDETDGKLYIKTNEGRTYNPFRKDDILLVQQYGGMPSEGNNHYITKQYEFLVTEVGVGSTALGERRLDWLKFTNFSTPMEGAGIEIIAEGDTLTRWDNLSDPTRKGVVTINSVGPDTPYIDFLYGMKTDPDNALKGRLGNLGGIYNPLFGWLRDFGAYLTSIYAVGEFVIAHTGENVADSIAMAQGSFRTNFRQQLYDMQEEDNYFHNTAWTNECEGWTLGADTTGYFLVGDLPQFFNFNLLSTEDSFAGVTDYDGRDMLRIFGSMITQANSLIRKPGTHKVHTSTKENEDGTYTKVYDDVSDTLYLSVRVFVRTSGTLEMGFTKNGSFISNAFHITRQLQSQTDSYEIKVSSTWDGVGDFTITSTGDMFIDLLSLTDRPLDNFRTETMTSIEQTAAAINLVAKRVSGAEGSITSLGISIDAAKKELKLYVNQETGKVSSSVSELKLTVQGLQSTVAAAQGSADQAKALANAAQTAANKASSAAAGAQSTANSALSKATSNATAISQNKDSISLLAGAFTLKNGKYELTEAAGVAITNKVATIYATQSTVDALGKRVTSAEASIKVNANSISTKVSANGVISAINQTSETIKINASRIELTGKVTFAMLDSNAQNTINGKATQANIDSTVNALKNTIISGGHIITSLIDVSQLRAQIVESTNTYGKLLIEGGQMICYDKGQNEAFSLVTGSNYTLMTIGHSADKSVTIHPSDISVWTTKGTNSLNDKGLTLCSGSSVKNFGLGNIASIMSSEVDFFIGSGTVTLPAASTCKGKMIFVKLTGSSTIRSSSPIYRANEYSYYTSDSFSARSMFFISNGTNWYEFLTYYRS